jgi:hypothetical protein
MKRSSSYLTPLIIGGALILFGVLFLLNNFDIVSITASAIFAGIFILAGLIFLIVFLFDNEHWWALIPGFVLMGVGGTILTGEYVNIRGIDISGAIMLFFIALPFWIIYILKRNYWWALIPAGTMTPSAWVTWAWRSCSPDGQPPSCWSTSWPSRSGLFGLHSVWV